MESHRASQSRPNFAGLLGLYCLSPIRPLYGYSISFDELLVLMLEGVPESSEFASTPPLLSQSGIVKLNDYT